MSSQLTSESPRRRLNARQRSTVERLLIAGQEELREVGHVALTICTVAVRAGVSPATAYTYLASKHHLFAELFLRHIVQDHDTEIAGTTTTERAQDAARGVVASLVTEPELAAAVTPALLGSDPDVARLRLRIGAEFVSRFETALGDAADPDVLEVLVLTLSGALLQAGMGVMGYDEMADRLTTAVAVIMKGHA